MYIYIVTGLRITRQGGVSKCPGGWVYWRFPGVQTSLCRGLVLCAPRKICARAFQWLSSVPCSCAGAGRSNAAFWNKCRSRVSMESSGDMSHQRVCWGGLSSPAVTSLRCARPARDDDVQVILVGFQGDGNERSGHPSHGACRMGSEVSAVFTRWKASSSSGPQGTFSGCPFLVRSVRGEAKEEKLGMKQR